MTVIYRGSISAAEDHFLPDQKLPGTSVVERVVLKHFAVDRPVPTETDATQPSAYAQVNWGRWVVQCPWCLSATLASREDHRFFCSECGNAPAGGKWVQVEWPDKWSAIEEHLVKRPTPRTRNWSPGETVDGLVAENIERGVI
jgi:hypothetical protein